MFHGMVGNKIDCCFCSNVFSVNFNLKSQGSDYMSRLLHGVQVIDILKFTSVLGVVIYTST